jgi:hypothetical protein
MTRVVHIDRRPRRDSGTATGLDLMLHLSELARQTRAPGQTLQSRLNELRREVGA